MQNLLLQQLKRKDYLFFRPTTAFINRNIITNLFLDQQVTFN
jgi:hypothetical protein